MSRRSKARRSKGSSRSRSKSTASSENFYENEEDGPTFEVKTSPIMGRYMVALRNLRPGETILFDNPLVVGPCNNGKVQCLGCYKNLEESPVYIRCQGCGWPLCSSTCIGLGKIHGHTLIECNLLNRTQFQKYKTFNEMRPYYNLIVPLRCLQLKDYHPEAYRALMTMESHNAIRRNIPELWRNNQDNVVNKIRDNLGLLEYTPEEIHNICGILEVNSFEIGQGVSLRGLYPAAFLMSHDCVPNTNHTDEDGSFNLTVRASVRIERGQPITLSYAYTLQNTIKRREHLLENKFFECRCGRCSDATELGTYNGALVCPKCKIGTVLSNHPLNFDADWSCSTLKGCPGYQISSRSMQLLIDRITQELESIDCNDVPGFENFLEKYRNVLHPLHYLCVGAKLSLSQIYGKITGYSIQEMSTPQLIRKYELCEELMGVLNVIEPGFTRIRGVTLYEMHAPLMILLTRQFEDHCSKSELRTKLRKVVKCLEEASLILGFESPNSPEGIMGVAAKDALGKIKNWEGILGKL